MPLNHRQIYRRRRLAVFGGILVALLVGLYLPFTLLAPLSGAQKQLSLTALKPAAVAEPAWPQFGASAFGVVGYDGLLESSGSNYPLPMASISKIVSALVILQAKPLAVGQEGPTITFSQANHDLYAHYLALQGSVEPMPVGGTMTEHQVLQVALMASANNYADTLAGWAFGSEAAYVAATKTWLVAHGLTHTTLVEPTGINPANASTASDLVALGKLALHNPVLAQIVDTPTLTLPIVGTIKDTNKLLGKEGVVGIKTGTLTTSSLLFASKYTVGGTTITIIGAVLGGTKETIYPAVSAVLATIKAGFHSVTLAKKGESFGTYTTQWNEKTDAVASSTISTVLWSNTPVTAVVALDDLRVGAKGDRAGSVNFTAGKVTMSVSLRLDRAIRDPGPLWRLANPFAALGIR